MLKIAITGGIACGKSTVVRQLLEAIDGEAAAHFDSDACVSSLYEDPDTLQEIVAIAPGLELHRNGGIDRKKLRETAFANFEFRRKLESILHPKVLKSAESFVRASFGRYSILLFEVPLLYEVDFPLKRDIDLVVAASRGTQTGRLVGDRHLDRGIAERMIDSQMPIGQKIERADLVVWNDGSEELLESQTTHLSDRCRPFLVRK